MRQKLMKWGATAAGVSVIAAAVISANVANAQDSTTSTASSAAASGNTMASSLGAFGQSLLEKILSLFAYPNSQYLTYLGNSSKINQQQTDANLISKQNSTNDTLQYLQQYGLYIDNVLDTKQNYAKQVPINQQTAQQNAALFNSGSLLNNYTLTTQQKPSALNYIAFLADTGNPIPSPKGNWVTNGTSATTSYLNSLGSYNAQLSTGLNTMFQLYEERLPQKALNGQSALAYDAAAANRRMQASWFSQISSPDFTPADVARENLVIQAEQRYELFQIRMQLESINTLIAAMQLQSLQFIGKPSVLASEMQARQSGTSTGN